MQLSLILIPLGCASYASAEPQVYNTTLRHTLFQDDSREVNRTVDIYFESLRNATFQPDIRFILGENYFANQTALLNGTSYTHAQLVTAVNTLVDIQYLHNSTMVGTLSDSAVLAFSSSLSGEDRKHFFRLLKRQRRATHSEIEAFYSYPTTQAFVKCASSALRGNLTAFISCRERMQPLQNQNLLPPNTLRRAGILNLNKHCNRMLTATLSMLVALQISGVIACIFAGPEMALAVFAVTFVPILAGVIGAGCVAYAGSAVNSLDQGLQANASAGDSADTQ